MTPLRQQMIEDMQLRGLAPNTQEAYVRAVRQLTAYWDKTPDLVIEGYGSIFGLVLAHILCVTFN